MPINIKSYWILCHFGSFNILLFFSPAPKALYLLHLLQVDLWDGQAQSPLVVDPEAGLPFLLTGREQEVGFLHHHPWGMVSKTTTKYKVRKTFNMSLRFI